MTTYQKLKKENAELRRQLNLVCLAPDSDAAQAIICQAKVNSQGEAAIWSDAPSLKYTDGSKFQGMIKHVLR